MLLNLPRALKYMEQYRLDALVATSWPNVLYLSDFYLWLQPVFKEYMGAPGTSDDPISLFTLITSRGDACLIVDHMCELAASTSWIADRYVFGRTTTRSVRHGANNEGESFQPSTNCFGDPIEALVAALQAHQLSDARIGFDMEAMPSHRLARIKSAAPRVQILNATNLIRLIRMVKSDEEFRRLQRAAVINEAAATESLSLAKRDGNMQDIAQCFQKSAGSQGAVFDHFAFSQRGVGFATEGDYRLTSREAMFVDFGCIFQHYYSDAGVTLFAGEPLDSELAACQILADCLQETANRLRPGESSSSIQQLMQGFFERHGLHGRFPHGHGIGIELRDYPILAPHGDRRIRDDCVDVSAELPIETGMVINLEAPVFEFNGSALQLEQTFLVGPNGATPLTDRDLRQPVLIGRN